MLENIFYYPQTIKDFIIYLFISIVFALASVVLYKYGSKKWHFSVAKFLMESVIRSCITVFPIYYIIEYLSNESTMLWYIGGYFVLILVFIKKIIAFEESIIDRLKRLNKNYQNLDTNINNSSQED